MLVVPSSVGVRASPVMYTTIQQEARRRQPGINPG
nr:MAG TPA: hypothetical protein [Caudoviricetes sp.]